MSAVVLVEGASDLRAVVEAARVLDVDLTSHGVQIVAMDGITNLGRHLDRLGDVRVAGLCDAGEVDFVVRHLRRRGLLGDEGRTSLRAAGFFVCDRDLEDELIRAVGADAVVQAIAVQGELESFRRLQQMPFHRDRTVEQQLHRFMGSKGGRKHRYATVLTRTLDAASLPAPLRALVELAADQRAG